MTVRAAIVTVSDRAFAGLYEDKGGPGCEDWLRGVVTSPLSITRHIIPDGRASVAGKLRELVAEGADLILVTGGTGPAPRDVTPQATLAVAEREMPGFGEQMRQISLHYVPTAILSRQTAVIRGQSLIVNLPGRPKSIAETLEGVRDANGTVIVHGIFSAIPYCIELMGGSYIDTHEAVSKAFRPKKA